MATRLDDQFLVTQINEQNKQAKFGYFHTFLFLRIYLNKGWKEQLSSPCHLLAFTRTRRKVKSQVYLKEAFLQLSDFISLNYLAFVIQEKSKNIPHIDKYEP